jgi:hypothetical protein
VSENTFNRSEKEEFLDRYFYDKLVQLITTIDNPSVEDRREHIETVLDNLFSIADEYQAVMIEKEESYWDSIEEWNDKCRQEAAIKWIKETLHQGI